MIVGPGDASRLRDESMDSPQASEKSNRSAPAARIFQENKFQTQLNAAVAMQNHTSHSESNQSQNSGGLQTKLVALQHSSCSSDSESDVNHKPAAARVSYAGKGALPRRKGKLGVNSAFKKETKSEESRAKM